MMDLIHTLPGYWLSPAMLKAARIGAKHLPKVGGVVTVQLPKTSHSYVVYRKAPRVVLVCLERDLSLEEAQEELKG